MHYALGMVKKAIPFRCKVNPFKSPPIKSMLGWMTMVEGGASMGTDAFLAAVKDSLRMPTSFLGKAFTNRLEKQSNPLAWLMEIEPQAEFRGNYARNVETFRGNVRVCFEHDASQDPSEVYSSLLVKLKSSDGKSFFDSIVGNIKEDNNKMAELAAENPDGIPTDEQIKEAAEEELVLLTGLMGSKETVDGVMGYVRELKTVNEKVAAGDDDDRDAVTIGTMHSWKGLECPKLFLPMVRGKFPRAKLTKTPDGQLECLPPEPDDPALASERRLAYVAMTRAEDSCVMMDIQNPSKAFSGCPPSQFIGESCVSFNGGEAPAAPEPHGSLGPMEDEPQGGIMEDDPWSPAHGALPRTPDEIGQYMKPKAAMDLDPLMALWNGDETVPDNWDKGLNWHDGPTDEEAEEAEWLNDMEKVDLDADDSGDEMLAMWFKTTRKES